MQNRMIMRQHLRRKGLTRLIRVWAGELHYYLRMKHEYPGHVYLQRIRITASIAQAITTARARFAVSSRIIAYCSTFQCMQDNTHPVIGCTKDNGG